MLEHLQNLTRTYAGDAIITNPAIPNERNDEAISAASTSIVGGLKDAVSKGNLSDVMNLFKGGEQAVPQAALTQNIQGGFVENLMQKFGLDQAKAMQIASTLIPLVMKQFVNKTNDPNDKSFNFQDILASLTGGSGIGGKDILGGLTGNGSNGKDGGLLGKVKGLF
jgi:uncharacterized protein YidB (DUF937 family)